MKASKHEADRPVGGEDAPREIELKLEAISGGVEHLLAHPLLTQAVPVPEQSGGLHAVYFDTPDLALRRAGLSLRIRRRDGRHIQTIKAESKVRGLALDRSEWESPVEDGSLDFAAAAGTPLAPLLDDDAVRAAIRPAFIIETERRSLEIRYGGSLIELALDDARVRAGSGTARFAELELELKEGDPSALFGFARDLAEAVPLRLAPITKSERGYGLLDGTLPEPLHAAKTDVRPDASCAEAFQSIARSCLSQVISNEAVLRRTRNPEAVHQMRVGLRRLRAAISLFKDMLADEETEEIKDDLRWAGQQLGPARDLDVFLERLLEQDAELAEDESEGIERRRRRAYDGLMETLDSARFLRVILTTAAWIEAGEWLADNVQAARPARDHAEEELSRRRSSIRRQARHLAELDDEDRHRLRIRIKKLRYGVEFFAPLFADGSKKRRKAMSAVLGRLQDVLGEMNDIAVGGSLLPSLASQDPEQAKRRMSKLLAKAIAGSQEFSALKPFWR